MDRHPPLHFPYPETPGLVSVITPTRNGRRFLSEALEGLAGQAYGKWELIVVEDGSQDGAEELVRQFAAAHPGRRVVYRRNPESCGAAYSRNLAFTESRGEYVAFLDCDDRWFPSHLQACVESLRDSGDDLVYSTVVMFADIDTRPLGVWGPTGHELKDFPRSLFGRSFVTPSATVLRRRVLGDVGGWDQRYACCEDTDFWIRTALAGKRFRYLGGVHCLYRKEHGGALTERIAETAEVFSVVTARYRNDPLLLSKRVDRWIANSCECAAGLHSYKRTADDPSSRPERAAYLYYRAWLQRPKRVRNLLRGAYCALRYGVSRGVQPSERTHAIAPKALEATGVPRAA